MSDYVMYRSNALAGQDKISTGTARELVESLFDSFPNVVIEADTDYPGCFDAFAYTASNSWVFAIQPVGFKLSA